MLMPDFSDYSTWLFSVTHMLWGCVTLGFCNSACFSMVLVLGPKQIYKCTLLHEAAKKISWLDYFV
jgi:hypothetical protein